MPADHESSTRRRGIRTYQKPALRHDDLLDRLIGRGLLVPDRDRALRYLRNIGYYRLSPYLIPFREEPARDTLRPGAAFDEVLELYVFDRRLRLLVLDAIARIEVSLRAAVTDHMSVSYDDPFWYVREEHFRDAKKHAELMSFLNETVRRHLSLKPEQPRGAHAHTSALEHYLTTYGSPGLPPSWVMIETLTIGQLNRVLTNLARRSDRTAVAASLGLPEPLLISWMKTYVRVRNVCAHHGRLWNLGLGVYPQLPKSSRVAWLKDPTVISDSPDRAKRLYPVLVSLQSLLRTISPRATWAHRLDELLSVHPNVPLAGMGVPTAWQEDPFWKPHLAFAVNSASQ